MWRDGRLLATYKDARAHLGAYLDDYAYLMAALIELLQSEFSLRDLEFAGQLAEVLLGQFEDAEGGGFFFTARDHEPLIHRPKPGYDNATPSGNALAAWALGRLAGLTAALDKPARPEPVNGWLCRGVNCLLPISDLVDLRRTFKERS